MANIIQHCQVVPRIAEEDYIYSWQTRTSDTDALYQWNGSSWTLLKELDGTDLIYDSAVLGEKLYWADGKNPIQVLNIADNTTCTASDDGPVVQYLIAYQERLVGAGDARTQAEVEADGGVWPADSNRNRVIFSEALDTDTWPPNNFIDADIGTGEVISGLGINSINSATKGAQTQLVVFTPTSTLVNDGALASADQRLAVASTVLGCPSYHTIINTPFGLMFCSRHTVCLLDQKGIEPQQIGFLIAPAIKDSYDADPDYVIWRCAAFHDNTYKLSICNDDEEENNEEWWLDLRPAVFPNEHNWFGPHDGDQIFQYLLWEDLLLGVQDGTDDLWELEVEDQYDSMTTTAARTSTMTWPRFKVNNIKKGKLDAYGFRGETDAATNVSFTETISYDSNLSTAANTFTHAATVVPVYHVLRPIRRSSYDAQVSISFSANADLEVHSVYLRSKMLRRQSEKQAADSQS